MKNIALIGMMGCGKSTAGKAAADAAGLRFRDTDDVLRATMCMTLTEVYNMTGTEGVREMEYAVCKSLSDSKDTIIAAGEGVVLSRKTMNELKRSSIVVFIDKPLGQLLSDAKTEDRPLLKGGVSRLSTLYNERISLYRQYADRTIKYTSPEELHAELMAVIAEAKLMEEEEDDDPGADELQTLRGQIDDIDRQLVTLMEKRLRVCDEVARVKKERELPLTDEAQEKIVYDRAIRRVTEESYDLILEFMKTVVNVSKLRQRRTLG